MTVLLTALVEAIQIAPVWVQMELVSLENAMAFGTMWFWRLIRMCQLTSPFTVPADVPKSM